MTRKSSSLQRLECGLFLIAVFISVTHSAPVHENDQTDLEAYDGETGCYYNYNHYGEGDRIMTNEPCLNCTCHNKMLMCYLRVCPFTKPIGQDCTVEKREDQCCPVITCPEVPVELVNHLASSSTELGAPEHFGCSIDGKVYSEGAQVPSHPHKPCELCYCIRNMTACVMQECTLHVEGCQPIYNKGVCCPVRYSCDHDSTDDLLHLEDATTTTVRPTPGFVLPMTTTLAPLASTECIYNEEVFGDGSMIMTEKPCEHCYCMRGDIVCAVQECGAPLENEGKNCTSMPPRDGQCCPDTYICDGTDIEHILPEVGDLEKGTEDSTTQAFKPAKGEHKDIKLDGTSTERLPATVTKGIDGDSDDDDLQQKISEVTGIIEEHGTTKGPSKPSKFDDENEKQERLTEAPEVDAVTSKTSKPSLQQRPAVSEDGDKLTEAPSVTTGFNDDDDKQEKLTESSYLDFTTDKYGKPLVSDDEDIQVRLTEAPGKSEPSSDDVPEKLTESPIKFDDKTQESLTESSTDKSLEDENTKTESSESDSLTEKTTKPIEGAKHDTSLEASTFKDTESDESATEKTNIPEQDASFEASTFKDTEAEDLTTEKTSKPDHDTSFEVSTFKDSDADKTSTRRPTVDSDATITPDTDDLDHTTAKQSIYDEVIAERTDKPSADEKHTGKPATDESEESTEHQTEEPSLAHDEVTSGSVDDDAEVQKTEKVTIDSEEEEHKTEQAIAQDVDESTEHADKTKVQTKEPESATEKANAEEEQVTSAYSDEKHTGTPAVESDEQQTISPEIVHKIKGEKSEGTDKLETATEKDSKDNLDVHHVDDEITTASGDFESDEHHTTSSVLDDDEGSGAYSTEKINLPKKPSAERVETETEDQTESFATVTERDSDENSATVGSVDKDMPQKNTTLAPEQQKEDDEVVSQHTVAPIFDSDKHDDDHTEKPETGLEHETDFTFVPESEETTDTRKDLGEAVTESGEESTHSGEQDRYEHTTLLGESEEDEDHQNVDSTTHKLSAGELDTRYDDATEKDAASTDKSVESHKQPAIGDDDAQHTTLSTDEDDKDSKDHTTTELPIKISKPRDDEKPEEQTSKYDDDLQVTESFDLEGSTSLPEKPKDAEKSEDHTTKYGDDAQVTYDLDTTTTVPRKDLDSTTKYFTAQKDADSKESATEKLQDEENETSADFDQEATTLREHDLDNEIHEVDKTHKEDGTESTIKHKDDEIESTTAYLENEDESATTPKHEDEDLQQHIDQDHDVHIDVKTPASNVEVETQRPTYLPPRSEFTTVSSLSDDEQTTFSEDVAVESQTEIKGIKPPKQDKVVPDSTTVGHDDLELPEREIVTELPSFTDIPHLPDNMEVELDTKSPLESDSHTLDASMTTQATLKDSEDKLEKTTAGKPELQTDKPHSIPEESFEMNTIIPSEEKDSEETTAFGTDQTTASSQSEEDGHQDIGTLFPSSEESDEGMFPSSIPGEGNCLLDGETYANNSMIPPRNSCQVSCLCSSSIIRCESVKCAPPPSTVENCVPVYSKKDPCCPAYKCDSSPDADTVTVTPQSETGASKDEEGTTVSIETETKLTELETPAIVKEIIPDMKQKDDDEVVTATVEEIKPTTEKAVDTGLHGIEKATKTPIVKVTTQSSTDLEDLTTEQNSSDDSTEKGTAYKPIDGSESTADHTDKTLEEPVTAGHIDSDSHVKESDEEVTSESETEKSVNQKLDGKPVTQAPVRAVEDNTNETTVDHTDKTAIEHATDGKVTLDSQTEESDEDSATESGTQRTQPGYGIKGKPYKLTTQSSVEDKTDKVEDTTDKVSSMKDTDKPIISQTSRPAHDENDDDATHKASDSLDENTTPSILDFEYSTVVSDVEKSTGSPADTDDRYSFDDSETETPTKKIDATKPSKPSVSIESEKPVIIKDETEQESDAATTRLPYDAEYEKEVASVKPLLEDETTEKSDAEVGQKTETMTKETDIDTEAATTILPVVPVEQKTEAVLKVTIPSLEAPTTRLPYDEEYEKEISTAKSTYGMDEMVPVDEEHKTARPLETGDLEKSTEMQELEVDSHVTSKPMEPIEGALPTKDGKIKPQSIDEDQESDDSTTTKPFKPLAGAESTTDSNVDQLEHESTEKPIKSVPTKGDETKPQSMDETSVTEHGDLASSTEESDDKESHTDKPVQGGLDKATMDDKKKPQSMDEASVTEHGDLASSEEESDEKDSHTDKPVQGGLDKATDDKKKPQSMDETPVTEHGDLASSEEESDDKDSHTDKPVKDELNKSEESMESSEETATHSPNSELDPSTEISHDATEKAITDELPSAEDDSSPATQSTDTATGKPVDKFADEDDIPATTVHASEHDDAAVTESSKAENDDVTSATEISYEKEHSTEKSDNEKHDIVSTTDGKKQKLPTATDIYEDESTTETSQEKEHEAPSATETTDTEEDSAASATESASDSKHDLSSTTTHSEDKEQDVQSATESIGQKEHDEQSSTDTSAEDDLSSATESSGDHEHDLPSATGSSMDEEHNVQSATEKEHDVQSATEKELDISSATESSEDKDHEVSSVTDKSDEKEHDFATESVPSVTETSNEKKHVEPAATDSVEDLPSATEKSDEAEHDVQVVTDLSVEKQHELDVQFTTEVSAEKEHDSSAASTESSEDKDEQVTVSHENEHDQESVTEDVSGEEHSKPAEDKTELPIISHKDDDQSPAEATTAVYSDEEFANKHTTLFADESYTKAPEKMSEAEDSLNRGDEFETNDTTSTSTKRPILPAASANATESDLERTTIMAANGTEEEAHHSTAAPSVGFEKATTTERTASEEEGTTSHPKVPAVHKDDEATLPEKSTTDDKKDDEQHEDKPLRPIYKPTVPETTDEGDDDSQKPISFVDDDDVQKPIGAVEEQYTKKPTESSNGSLYGGGSGAGSYDTGSGYPSYPQPPVYGGSEDDYVEEEDPAAFGPGTCRYGGKLYVSAQQIPRDDPCDFCFCFRSDIICLQQSCPPPISGCHEEPISGFCCPRYECPVSMATVLNVTTSTTTTTTTLPPHFMQHAYKGAATKRGCQIQGKAFAVGEDVASASGPCMRCTCGGDGQMKCDPKACSPEPMLRQMIAVAASRKR